MATIQVVLDSNLLRVTDGAARKARVNRSALVRRALREYLKALRIKELEDQDRRGYEKYPDDAAEAAAWAKVAAWPEP